MTVAWVLYGLVVGGFLALTARCVDDVCRLFGRPTRWVWLGSLVLTVALVGVAPRRAVIRPPVALTGGRYDVDVAAIALDRRSPRAAPSWRERLHQARARTVASAETALDAVNGHVPPALGRYLGALWISLTTLLLVALVLTYGRFARLRRSWPIAELHGVRVRVANAAGPAVVGLFRPEIIIPGWLLRRTAEEQRLVLAHEREHVGARDPLLIIVACVTAALVPWHPAIWWMLSRFRLAVELDCDRRVLRGGAAPRTYGALLIDLAGRHSGLTTGAAALTDKSSHLQQRLLAMKPIHARFALARGGIAGAFAVLFFTVAWTARVPVAVAQVADSGVAKRPATDTVVAVADTTVLHADAVNAPGDRRRLQDLGSAMPDAIVVVDGVRMRAKQGDPNGANSRAGQPDARSGSSGSPLDSIDPNSIEKIEVFKGPSAATLYGADAANGIIVITTKKGSKQTP